MNILLETVLIHKSSMSYKNVETPTSHLPYIMLKYYKYRITNTTSKRYTLKGCFYSLETAHINLGLLPESLNLSVQNEQSSTFRVHFSRKTIIYLDNNHKVIKCMLNHAWYLNQLMLRATKTA